jgi:hypothetical protein
MALRLDPTSMTESRSYSAVPLRGVAIVLVAIGLVPLANLLTAGHAVPWWRAAVLEWSTVGLAIVLVSVLLAARAESWLVRIVEAAKGQLLRSSPRSFELGAAILVTIVATFFAQYCFSRLVFTGDEMAQRWHARMLLAGRLFLQPEVHREFFSTAEMIDEHGRWFSQFPIGGPAVIAVGMALGVPWLVNPLLAGLTAANLHRFLRRAYDDVTARAATVLFAVSPFVLIMSASQLNHVATLALVTLALAELPLWVGSADARVVRRSGVVIGLAVGGAIAVRPLDGALVAIVIGAFQVHALWRDPSRRTSLLWQVAGSALLVALLLWCNARTTGSPLLFGYDALNGTAHRPGFHVDPLGVGHTPLRALAITSGYVMKLNRYLFEWPLPAVAILAAALWARGRASRWDYLLAGLFAATLAGYATYWFDGFFAGPRFLYTAIPALVLFAATLPRAVGERFARPAIGYGAIACMTLAAVYAWVTPTGVSSVQMRALYYRSLREQLKTDIGAEVGRARLTNALVFVNDSWHARLAARLRALGAKPMAADQLLDHLDACALQSALDADDAAPRGTSDERLERVLGFAQNAGIAVGVPGTPADQRIAIVPGSKPTDACLAQVAMDAEGTMPYAAFLAFEGVGDDGRLGGQVVFARDMGARNELLRERFGDRAWYRYVPVARRPANDLAFAPYDRGEHHAN